MQSALLARSLGRPRHEVDGRFDRAERIAERVGHAQQRMRVAYMRTWTAYWWYDDTDELTRGYDRVEEFAIGSHQCADLEKLVNLWLLLNAAVWLSLLETDKAKLADRTLKLEAALRRLSTETERPNNALLAKVHLILMGLHEAFGSEEKTESIFRQLQEVIEADHDNPAFPFGFLLQIIQELDSLFPDNERLDPIFECVVRLTAERASKGTAGCLLLRRGCEKFQSSHRYEAIRLLGRAQENLTMEEYAEEFIRSLVVCAFAYESAGLLWAARRNMLVAASVTLTGFAKHGTIVSGCLDSLKRLTWLELQLGRIPHALCWIELQELIAGHLALQGQDLDRFRRDLAHQDVVLGLLLLKTDTASLKELDFMPQILDRMGLCSSWMALLFTCAKRR